MSSWTAPVSNPISGEVGAAAAVKAEERKKRELAKFQTPSAGRWVLQHLQMNIPATEHFVSNPISGEVGAAARAAQ